MGSEIKNCIYLKRSNFVYSCQTFQKTLSEVSLGWKCIYCEKLRICVSQLNWQLVYVK